MSDPREPYGTIRPLLVEAAVVHDESPPRARVALEHGGELFVGEAPLPEEASVASPRAAAAAEAAVAALDMLTPSGVQLSLQWSAVVPTSDGLPPVAATMVGITVAGVPLRYAGAVVVGGDTAVAGARSALDALNRRLGVTGL